MPVRSGRLGRAEQRMTGIDPVQHPLLIGRLSLVIRRDGLHEVSNNASRVILNARASGTFH